MLAFIIIIIIIFSAAVAALTFSGSHSSTWAHRHLLRSRASIFPTSFLHRWVYHQPFSQFHALFSVFAVLFGLPNSRNPAVLISNEGKKMGWESFCWKTHLFWLWFWTGKSGFWTDLPKRNLLFFPFCFWVLGNNAFLVKPISWMVFLDWEDWALKWITKREHFLGRVYFFGERNKCFWNGDF